MKTVIAAMLCAALSQALPAFAALEEGEEAPDFSAQASLDGKAFTFSLESALAKGPVVVYFYPSAYTGGCNIQARTFAINKDKFDGAGATIIGVSQDDIQWLNRYSADPDYCGGKFPVASDPDGAIAKAYDLKIMTIEQKVQNTLGEDIDHAFTERTTFVITPDSRIAATLSSADDNISPAEHVDQSLAVVEGLNSGSE